LHRSCDLEHNIEGERGKDSGDGMMRKKMSAAAGRPKEKGKIQLREEAVDCTLWIAVWKRL
jgi:hypothetical protein